MIIHLHLAIHDNKCGACGHTSNAILPTLDITRLNEIIHCVRDNKNSCHNMGQIWNHKCQMDMSTPWLARKARHGVSISMHYKVITGEYRECAMIGHHV